MTLRYSAGASNYIAQHGGYKDAFQNGRIEIRDGSQPASADAAATGNLLCTITNGGGAHTAEVLATGSVTLNTGASGSVDNITVNAVSILHVAVPFNTSLAQTATDVAAAINNSRSAPDYTASASGAIITIRALRGTGASVNGFVVASTTTTITKTDANMAGGVNPVNGLLFDSASARTLIKRAVQAWSGTNVAAGTAGWYRLYGSVSDAGAVDSTESTIREDGAIATSGAQLNLSSVTFANGGPTALSTWSRTLPAS